MRGTGPIPKSTRATGLNPKHTRANVHLFQWVSLGRVFSSGIFGKGESEAKIEGMLWGEGSGLGLGLRLRLRLGLGYG